MPSELPFEGDRYARQFACDGYFIREGVISDVEVERLRTAVACIPDGEEVRRRRGVYGVRNLLEICPAVEELARQTHIRQFVTPVLGDSAFAVRAIFFDKVPGFELVAFLAPRQRDLNLRAGRRRWLHRLVEQGRRVAGAAARADSCEHRGRARAP